MLESLQSSWLSSGLWVLSPRTPWVDSFMSSWSSRSRFCGLLPGALSGVGIQAFL